MDILHEDNIVTSVHLRGEEEQEEIWKNVKDRK